MITAALNTSVHMDTVFNGEAYLCVNTQFIFLIKSADYIFLSAFRQVETVGTRGKERVVAGNGILFPKPHENRSGASVFRWF